MTLTISEGIELHADELAAWLLRGSKLKLFILMGLPASGKSTLCERLEKLGAVRISRDLVRKRLYGDEGTYGVLVDVNREYYKELREAFAKGIHVISDNVNITINHRKGSLAAASECGYNDITIIWVDVPVEVALERNANRDRKVPENAIRGMNADLQKEGGPSESEGKFLKLHNGKDREHYLINKIRPTPQVSQPETAPNQPGSTTPEKRRKLTFELRTQVNLLDACVAANRDQWAAETLTLVRQLADAGITLFSVPVIATTPLTPTLPAPGTVAPKPTIPAKKPWIPPTAAEVTQTLLKLIGSRPVVTGDGPLVALCFNGHLLTAEKAKTLLEPLLELVKRAHIVFVQESNVDALRIIARAAHYGLNVSHRNMRDQACGLLFHPRLHWLGKSPVYHDYLLDVPGHPEYKASLRPAVQRRVRDLATGQVIDFVDLHSKSNLGGPDQTRPTRRWQMEALVAELARQTQKSPYEPREAAKSGTTGGDTKPSALVDNTGYDLPLNAVIIGGDYNAPIEKPETTEVEPLLAAGFTRVSTPDLRWSYQYRGNGGQFDGFFVRGLDGQVGECFIPAFPDNKRDTAFYREISDHMPVFMVVNPPVATAASATAPPPTTETPTPASVVPAA